MGKISVAHSHELLLHFLMVTQSAGSGSRSVQKSSGNGMCSSLLKASFLAG